MKRLFLITAIFVLCAAVFSCRRGTANTNTNANVAAATPESESTVAPLNLAEVIDPAAALAEGNRLMDENDTDKAIEAYKRATELDADFPEPYFRLGIAYDLLQLQRQQRGEIVEDAPVAETKKKKDNGKGKDKDKGKDRKIPKTDAEKAFTTAVEKYEKWIDKHDNDDNAYFYLGRTYAKLGEDEDARDAFKEAVRIKPDDSEYQTEYGAILIRLAQYHEAVAALKKAVDLDGSNSRAVDLLDDAEAGRTRMDYAIQKLREEANSNSDSGSGSNSSRKGSDANSISNSGSVPSSNSAPKPGPDEHTKPKIEEPKKPERKDKKGGTDHQ